MASRTLDRADPHTQGYAVRRPGGHKYPARYLSKELPQGISIEKRNSSPSSLTV